MSTKNVQWSQNLEQAEIRAGKRKLTLSDCRNFVAPEVFEQTTPIKFPDVDVSKFSVKLSEDYVKRMHINLILSSFNNMCDRLLSKQVSIGINNSDTPLVTSDDPVTKIDQKGWQLPEIGIESINAKIELFDLLFFDPNY